MAMRDILGKGFGNIHFAESPQLKVQLLFNSQINYLTNHDTPISNTRYHSDRWPRGVG